MTASENPSNQIDWTAALEFTGGDEELLRDVIEILPDEAAAIRKMLRKLLAKHEAEGLTANEQPQLCEYEAFRREAHTLKGSLRILGKTAAFDSAETLEKMGMEKDLSGAPEVMKELEPALDQILQQVKARLGS
jgi:HPt (histidine-containing phosphotransfer) domain-containing protein